MPDPTVTESAVSRLTVALLHTKGSWATYGPRPLAEAILAADPRLAADIERGQGRDAELLALREALGRIHTQHTRQAELYDEAEAPCICGPILANTAEAAEAIVAEIEKPWREAAQALVDDAEPDDNFEGEYLNHLVPSERIERLRALLATDDTGAKE